MVMECVKTPPSLPLRQTQEPPLGLLVEVDDVTVFEVGQLSLASDPQNGCELILRVPTVGGGEGQGEVPHPLHTALAIHILGGRGWWKGQRGGGGGRVRGEWEGQ